MSTEFRSAAEVSLEELAATASRGFEGYFVPIRLDAPTLLTMVRVDSVDLAASVVAFRDGKPAGVALIARRGWNCRLATMSVVPEFRGQRIGTQLVRHLELAARQRGDRKFVLECIEQNAPALRLYHSAGFTDVRRLVGYTGEAITGASDPELEELDPVAAAMAVARWGAEELPWPMAAQTLAALSPPHRAFRLGAAWAIISSPAEKLITIRTLVVAADARRQGCGTRMVRALVARFPERNWRFAAMTPEEIPGAFFRRLGFHLNPLTQFQMARAW